jgi:hypothetical protein
MRGVNTANQNTTCPYPKELPGLSARAQAKVAAIGTINRRGKMK